LEKYKREKNVLYTNGEITMIGGESMKVAIIAPHVWKPMVCDGMFFAGKTDMQVPNLSKLNDKRRIENEGWSFDFSQ